jgi:hypothetical protein
MSIGSGLLGYIGGTASSSTKKHEDVHENTNQTTKDEAK